MSLGDYCIRRGENENLEEAGEKRNIISAGTSGTLSTKVQWDIGDTQYLTEYIEFRRNANQKWVITFTGAAKVVGWGGRWVGYLRGRLKVFKGRQVGRVSVSQQRRPGP